MTDDQYYSYFGMEKDPFSDISSDSEYFLTPELEHRIELIKHLVEFSDRIVVITGDAGSGKTSLLNHLICNPDEKWNRCRLEFNNINSVEDFFSQLYQDQKLEYRELDSYPSKVSALQDYFNGLQFKGYIPVIFIDDAHYLSIEILKLLFELAITPQKKPCLHIVLFSETKIADLVNHKNLGYIHSLDMPLFDEQQTVQYIEHRLHEAGYSGDAKNTDKFINQIYRTSAGMPGLVNELAAQALQDPAVHKTEKKPVSKLQSVLLNPRYTLPAALVLLAMFMTYIFYAEPEAENIVTEEQAVELPQQQPEPETEPEFEPVTEPAPEVVFEPQIVADEAEPAEQDVTEQDKAAKENQTEADMEQTISDKESEPSEQVVEVEIEPIIEEAINKQSEENLSAKEPSEIVVLNTEGEIVKSIKPEPEPEPEPKPEDTKPLPDDKKPIENKAQTEVQVTNKQPEVSTVTGGLRGVDWLKQQPADHYVLQLMGAHDGTAMDKFIDKHKQYKSQFAKFKTVNQNKLWYVLVYGKYSSRDQAVAAVAKLPPVLKDLKPWPRRIETIQQDL